MKQVRHIAGIGDIRNAYKIFVGRSEGNEAIKKFWNTRKNNFETVFRERVFADVDRVKVSQYCV
jgi:hypothetical protein